MVYCGGEYGNKFSHSIEGREFLEQLGGYKSLKKCAVKINLPIF
jgi:hypothetical protein